MNWGLKGISFLFITSIFFSGCGSGNNTDVTAQSAMNNVELTLSGRIFTGLNQGDTPCSYTCGINVTAGTNSTVKAQNTFSNLMLKCDSQGEAVSAQQVINTTVMLDLNDPEIQEGIVIQANCKPVVDLVNTATFGLVDGSNTFSKSINVNVQQCARDSNCKFDLDLTSLLGSVEDSGLLTLAGNLTCPTITFFHSSCTTQSTWCTSLEFLAGVAGCELGGATNKCGNHQIDEGEECDGSVLPCGPGKECLAPDQPAQCTCTPVTACNCSTVTCKEGFKCNPDNNCNCESITTCGNGVRDGDENCGEPNLPACADTAECKECHCLASACPVIPPGGPGSPEICNDGCDNDGDGDRDCNDPDCSSNPACGGGVPVCGNGVRETGESCGEPGLPTCPSSYTCTGCNCLPDSPTVCAVCHVPPCLPETLCHDNCDNDSDGLFDCFDTDCLSDPSCPHCPFDLEACNDSCDNDRDGMIDCDDPDCASDSACATLNCTRGVCSDTECAVMCNGTVECGGEHPGLDESDAYCPTNGECPAIPTPGSVYIICPRFSPIEPITCALICEGNFNPDKLRPSDCPNSFPGTLGIDESGFFCGNYFSELGPCKDGLLTNCCADSWDADGDSLTDCDDPDCGGDPNCFAPTPTPCTRCGGGFPPCGPGQTCGANFCCEPIK